MLSHWLETAANQGSTENGCNMESRLLYDRKEAARQLSLSVRSVDYAIANKELDTRRHGRRVLITHASLVRYASSNHYQVVKKNRTEGVS